jgi:membrane-associated protease RseP (regulator of RpoE activity)
MVVLLGFCLPVQAEEAESGKIVQISPEVESNALGAAQETDVPSTPSYWIGVRGRSIESAVLRTQLQLAEAMGVVVEETLPDSPAAQAGLRRHDIILRANGEAIEDMRALQAQVEQERPLELKILRLGNPETVVVVPALRPQSLATQLQQDDRATDPMQQLLERFGLNARNLGPGSVLGGGQPWDLNQMPSGVSVSIQRNQDGPAQITVKRGDQTWQLEGDDQQSLETLPEELRPFVQQLLAGQSRPAGGVDLRDFNAQFQQLFPGEFGLRRLDAPDGMRERMERLEQRFQSLEQQFDPEAR